MELFVLLIMAFFLFMPLMLTGMNLFLLLRKFLKRKVPETTENDGKTAETDSDNANPPKEESVLFRITIDFLIFVFGCIFTLFLWHLMNFHDWFEPLYGTQNMDFMFGSYSPLNLDTIPTVLTFAAIAIVGFWILRIFETKLPPLIAAFCYSSIFIGFILTFFWVLQLMKAYDSLLTYYFMLFPLNYCICSLRLIHGTLGSICERIKNAEYKNSFIRKCGAFLSRAYGFMILAFILAFPIIVFSIIILTLFGQAPDAAIKAFTETAEWTLSQKIPPPRIDADGHYLCTVAARGDEKTVKPLRAGKRRGQLIVVNRQLLIANAFEDLIKERTPRLHRLIRGVYDRIGLPVSKHINTRKRADAVYFIMKPLEWFFLLILYTFDSKPENRISVQYTK